MFTQSFEKTAGRGTSAAIGGVLPIAAGAGADEGKGWQTTGGALAGSIAGAVLGRRLMNNPKTLQKVVQKFNGPKNLSGKDWTALKRNAAGHYGGAMAGGATGAALAHGKNKEKKD